MQPPSLVALRALKPCSPRVMKTILEFHRLIRLVVDHSISEMVLHQWLHPCPDSQSEMMLLVTSGSLCICLDQPKPTPLMLGMQFPKEQRCVKDYGKDLIQFPMQSDCWWPLLVSSRGLHSMPLCVQHWSSHHKHNDKLLPQGTSVWRFLMETCIYQTMST